jgi:uncharacterized protein (UPF0335 family)
MGDRPWNANEGKYDRSSSSVVTDRARAKAVTDEPRERDRGIEVITVDPSPSAEALPDRVIDVPPARDADRPARRSHAAEQLRSYVERMERLIEERKEISAMLAELRGEAKGAGYNVEAIQAIIKRRADPDKDWDTLDALVALYGQIVGAGGGGLDPLLDQARDAGLIAATAAAAGASPAPARKASAKDLQLAEALGWAISNRVH